MSLASANTRQRIVEKLTGAVSMGNQFVVFIDHSEYDLGTWAKAAGLSVRWDFCEYRSSDDPNYLWRSPGVVKFTPIKLSRAACSDSRTVQQWLSQTTRKHTPLSGSIQLVDSLGSMVVEWRMKEFFPVAWDIKEFDAGGTANVALETLEFVHSGFLDNEVKRAKGAI
ncbi:MAG: phage tail protein [Actinomycetota bacterium]|nr:phage tail protein [Actinomycetota bacterium]